jgi:neutral amino acid transport system ATP-binding protein
MSADGAAGEVQDHILEVRAITRAFGGLIAVDVDHLAIRRNLITALIGPNGAGKTTLFNLLTGFDQPNTGTWTFDGQSMNGMAPHVAAKLGLVRTFQLTKALARMSVMDNMLLGASQQRGERFLVALRGGWKSQEERNRERATELLERFKLSHMIDELAGGLSGGQRKLLEMARALMTEPKMVMLDEPMAGVNPALKQSLLEHIKLLRDEGRTVLFVEHDMDMVREISDWVVVMAEGRIISQGTSAHVASDRAVIDAYLGARHDIDLGDTA